MKRCWWIITLSTSGAKPVHERNSWAQFWTALGRCSRRVPGWQVQQTFPACMWDCSGVTAHLLVFHAAHRTASALVAAESGALISGSCCCRCSFTVMPLDVGKGRISQKRQEINYILTLIIKISYILYSSQFNYIKDDLCWMLLVRQQVPHLGLLCSY